MQRSRARRRPRPSKYAGPAVEFAKHAEPDIVARARATKSAPRPGAARWPCGARPRPARPKSQGRPPSAARRRAAPLPHSSSSHVSRPAPGPLSVVATNPQSTTPMPTFPHFGAPAPARARARELPQLAPFAGRRRARRLAPRALSRRAPPGRGRAAAAAPPLTPPWPSRRPRSQPRRRRRSRCAVAPFRACTAGTPRQKPGTPPAGRR